MDLRKKIYFDIDGVLNHTPARGNLGFGVVPELCERMVRLIPHGDLICISYWRGADPKAIVLPFPFTLAPNGNKRDCCADASVIIDDQPQLYNLWQPVHRVDCRVGFTEADLQTVILSLQQIDKSRIC